MDFLDKPPLRPDRIKVQQPVDLTQQVVLRYVILDPESVKQVLLRIQPSHHRLILLDDIASESVRCASIKEKGKTCKFNE